MALCCRKCARTEFCISLHDWPQQVIFMDCLQVAHIWHSKEVCNFYTLSSSLFILWKPHSKGQPCSASLPNFKQKEKSWVQSQDRGAKQTHHVSYSPDMLLVFSQLQGQLKWERGGISFLIEWCNILVLLCKNVCLLWTWFSPHRGENEVRPWTLLWDALDWVGPTSK